MAEQSILTVISRQSKTKGRTDDENRSSCKGHKKKRIATVHRQPSWNGSLVRKRDSQRSSSWSSIREHCPCYWNRNWRSYWWDSRTDFGKSEEKKDSKWFTITPHCAHRSDGLCAIFPPEPQNHTPYPLKTAQNGADDFWGRESLCSRLPGVRFQCDPILNCQKNKKYDFHENGERAGNLLPNRESVGEGIGAQPWPGSKGMKSLCKDTPIRDRARSVFVYTSGSLVAFEFTHRFSHLWRNV